MKKQKDIWFPAKKFGFGWGLPIKWQGWVVLIVYALFLIIGAMLLTRPSIPAEFFIGYIVIISVILVVICWIKGEKNET